MAARQLDSKTALIVIDLQKMVLSFPTAHPLADILAKAGDLIEAFRRQALPVILVKVVGMARGRTEQRLAVGALPPGWSDLLPELNQQPGDHLISKSAWGAFAATDLDAYLRAAGCTQLVICGVATSIGVESTARQAHELGYHVTIAVDAVTDISAEAHANSVERIFPRLGETGATAEIIDLLAKRGA